jgi:methyl-accepting chemotaxis protein
MGQSIRTKLIIISLLLLAVPCLIKTTVQVSEQSSEYIHTVAASAEEQNASMEEVTAAANNLSKMAEDLQQAISMFKIRS